MANVRAAPSRARATGAADERMERLARAGDAPADDYFFGAGVAVNSPPTSNGLTSIVPFISLAEGSVAV